MPRSLLPTLLAAMLALTHVPAEVKADVDESLRLGGWQEITFNNKERNRFNALKNGGIDIVSQGSVSLLQRPVSVDIGLQPIFRWRWCVTDAAPETDLAIRDADDRSLVVYVAFPYVAEEATAFEQIERKIVEATVGKDAPGRILMYVWGGKGERGLSIESPHMGSSGVMKILRPAATPSGQWFDETVDIADDYRKAFGKEPPNPVYIAVSADTDDTKSRSRGLITNLGFTGAARMF